MTSPQMKRVGILLEARGKSIFRHFIVKKTLDHLLQNVSRKSNLVHHKRNPLTITVVDVRILLKYLRL